MGHVRYYIEVSYYDDTTDTMGEWELVPRPYLTRSAAQRTADRLEVRNHQNGVVCATRVTEHHLTLNREV